MYKNYIWVYIREFFFKKNYPKLKKNDKVIFC